MLVQVILIAIPCWLKRTEQSRTLQYRWLVPGSKRREREQRSYDARDRDASLRLKSVSSDQSAVSRVEKGRMSRRVSWRGDHLQRPDPVAMRERTRGPRLACHISTPQLVLRLTWIEAALASKKTRIACRNHHLCVGQLIPQRVERSHVIYMRVRQSDAHNGRPLLARSFKNIFRAARQPCIDQGKTIILSYKETVERNQARKLYQVIAMSCNFHEYLHSLVQYQDKLIYLVYILNILVYQALALISMIQFQVSGTD